MIKMTFEIITLDGAPWIDDWQNGELIAEDEPDIREWIQSRPESVRKLMLKFPPSCLVKANRPLHCPAPDKVGIVTSYTEPDEEHSNGQISVRAHPDAVIRFQCDPECLEVVGYWRGLTPEKVQEYMEET